jgi:hypothetical protein
MRDLYDLIGIKPVIAPVVSSSNSPVVGAIINRSGFESVTYVIETGILTSGATFAVLLEEGNQSNLSDAATVADTDTGGTQAGVAFTAASNDGATLKLGYIGAKQYTRLTITPSGNAGSGASSPIAAIAILGHANVAPVA